MDERLSRRSLLAAAGTGALAGWSGCLGGDGGAETEADDGTESGGGNDTDGDGAGGRQATLPVPELGQDGASVTVTVFEDFACPHCKTFNEDVFPQIREEYVSGGVVTYQHRDFPIPVDEPVSWQAPSAARAIQDEVGEEAFFEYADALFANQNSLGPETYASLAEDYDVEASAVRSAAEEREYDPTVERDREYGVDNGVRGTPTVFVNGEATEGNDFETISATIESARRDGSSE
ncbi:DsbA family protein [Halomicrobium salinisoli]|uniref:DsbA family protein n=1 Tax=Halomicrobium salinisoli TaxID=2878391 RepID=UPI001CEFC0F8|nr:thioredoxin domain-containing protein [Halomicrobium salinisoli]